MPKYQPEEYWEKRSLQRLTSAEKSSIQYLKKIQSTYRSAARSVVNTVKETYASYYRNDETFSQELLEEIEPKGNITKFLNNMAKAGLDTSLPENFKGRMSRLRMLEAQLWAESKKVAIQERNISTKSYEKTLTNTYYRTIYDVLSGTGTNTAFATLNQRTIEKILETKFEGSNYSERIWKNTDILANSLQDILARAVATGQSPERTIREVMERFDVGFSNASRLVRTETNYFENKAELESYKELGIKKFKFLATLDERTSDICRSMDSKVFNVKDAEQGENVPPLHPYCRSTIVPVVDGFESRERNARNEEGETYLATNQPYNEWIRKVQKSSPDINALNLVNTKVAKSTSAPQFKPFSDAEIMHLDENAEKIINFAPREEDYALENYTGLTFDPINKYLWGTYEGNPNILQDIKALDSLLNRNKTPRNAKVFRAIKTKDYAKLIESGEGTEFVFKGFTSTSAKEHIAEEFLKHYQETGQSAMIAEINVPKGTPSFFIGPRSMHSNGYNEAELLLKRGLTYKIKSITKDRITFEIILNEE
ncbi:minor capsid protein [Candidatus Saccharibacteria bacterium]|nr:minor capsid protein [Candidatus Saccharibacteria bacterium]